jgi:PAS domain S-box-containing protein
VGATTALKLAASDAIGEDTPYLFYFVPVTLAAWLGGRRVGVITAVAAGACAYILFQRPAGAALLEARALARLAGFAIECAVLVWIVGLLDRASRRALAGEVAARDALDRLAIREEWFATTLRSIGDAVIVTSDQGRVTFMNTVAERVTGWTAGEADGRPLREVFPIFSEVTGEPVAPPVERVLREGVIVGMVNHTVLHDRAGRAVSIDHSAAPIRDPSGTITGVVLVFRDVSAERRGAHRREFLADATEMLARSLDYETTLRSVAAAAVPVLADWCAIDLLGDDGRLERVAAAHVDPEKQPVLLEMARRHPLGSGDGPGPGRILRTGAPEHLREVPPQIIDDAGRDPEHLAMLRALAPRSYLGVPIKRGDAVIGALTLATQDPHRLYEREDLATARELAERAGAAIERARLYREAQHANRTKDEFLAVLGHELRNPLAPILTALQLMQVQGPKVYERTHAIIERQTRHMVRIVDDLLDVSRITRGKLELQLETVRIADVISRAIEMISPAIAGGAHQLAIELDDTLVVRGDPARLAQVFANLLANSAKYTDKGGRIAVEARRDGAHAVVVVRDNGMGIAPEMLPHVFELFSQERQAIDRASGGLGLGLAIVRSLVEQHGGAVSARSEGLGKGSEVEVRLPVLPAAPAAVRAASAASAASAARASHPAPPDRAAMRVLVVDDNADALDLLGLGLQNLGHEVHTAGDGDAAIALAARVLPELAVLDLGLPGMDGYELARRLREASPSIKLIALTGYGQEGDRARTADAGFDEHLVKPASIAKLGAAIERLRVR